MTSIQPGPPLGPLVPTATVRFASGVGLRVAVAETPTELRRGLMFRDSLGAVDGMLFLLRARAVHTFWMRGVRFALDIVWIEAGRVVGLSTDAQPCEAPPCATYTAPVPVSTALEVPGGFVRAHGIAVGDAASIERD